METKKKNILSFKEFLEDRKKKKAVNSETKINWEERKTKWLNSVTNLYSTIDNIIINNLESSGYVVIKEKQPARISEEYIGSYSIDNYLIKADTIQINFFPIGTIIIGSYGRVDMVLHRETIKLVLPEWGKWKIVSGFGSSMKLIDFNEENIVKIFQENL